ncbi:F-box protein At2g34280-like [Apium graveolens]|uniref:F-box protein At2g34280-like n=1 Tax=Apium graveolens TaxID=4045 RepID=UPI003D7AE385
MKKQRSARTLSIDDLPVHLIYTIFIRIPIKSLLQLRSVSKSWCKIIDNPVFALVQYDCGEVEQNTLLYRTKDSTWTTLYSAAGRDIEEARMIHAANVPMVKFPATSIYHSCYGFCNGLMYIAENFFNTRRILVINPLKSQFTTLPPLPLKEYYCWNSCWTAIGLGFDSLTKSFKMVYSYQRSSSVYCTLVHTLGTTSWREVPGVPACYCMRPDYKSVFVRGSLHWMMNPSMIENCQGRILVFDVSKETFEVILHPELCFEGHSDKLLRLMDIKENLGMLDLSRDEQIDIWVMDYEKKSWGREYIIDITIVGDEIHVDVSQVIGVWKQDEILFYFGEPYKYMKYWSYNMRTGKIKEREDLNTNAQEAQVYSLKGSLLTISGAFLVRL